MFFVCFSCDEELPGIHPFARPATKISLGSKKNDPPKIGNLGVEAPVPTGLPLTATHPASPSGEKEASQTAKRGKEKEVLEVEEVVTLKCMHRDGSSSTSPLNTSVGTWAFTGGRRAMQNDIRAALEASIDEADLPKLLAVLPEDVPDPGPTPFSKILDAQASDSVAGASAGPTAEAVAKPSTEPPKGGE
nr:uncharacterized protein LOC109164486 isoform X3 [Ipomoea trifida]